jgi:hypothetical protein
VPSQRHFLITWKDRKFHTQDLTGRELLDLETVLGPWVRWAPAAKARDCAFILAAFLRREAGGNDLEKVMESEVLPVLNLDFLSDNVEIVKADLPTLYEEGMPDPPPAGEASTST